MNMPIPTDDYETQERAAIKEFDGKMPREQAEKEALEEKREDRA